MPDPFAFTGAALDRIADGRRRDAAWVAARLADPAARAVVGCDAGLAVADGRLALVPRAELPADAEVRLLGLDAEGPVLALDEGPPRAPDRPPTLVGAGGRRGEPAPTEPGRLGLREAAQTLPHGDGGLAAYAAALLNWHRRHGHCGVCGAASVPAEGGASRRCPTCGTHHHPRTDPVVIMLVHDGARVLLGRQRSWPAGRYSALAGFVSPGESLEEAVAREVREEAGVAVGAPTYHGSQPWPFPASLMLGFRVPYRGGEVGGEDDELEDVRWWSRAEVTVAVTEDGWDAGDPAGGLRLPPRSAIARRLVEGWLAA